MTWLPPNLPLARMDGQASVLDDYDGQVLLVVNTASQCGFTPQYEGLQALHLRYHDQGLAVLAFPCDQFGNQEPGSGEEIAAFCRDQYRVSFPVHEKTTVNGSQAHPLFRHLKQAAPGLLGSQGIKWNFTKFLVSRSREEVRRYAPTTSPSAITSDIEGFLTQASLDLGSRGE
ncbi:MAG: glutathione peroxidase [Deltaproteobacteria bacterium]|nr:glutathione peroxidase [Deltaproteobacteria bacterium]|tara:strand:+ start:857 stop:1375 length:519 start_codon:yes stop_codon:yes gene_type:complete